MVKITAENRLREIRCFHSIKTCHLLLVQVCVEEHLDLADSFQFPLSRTYIMFYRKRLYFKIQKIRYRISLLLCQSNDYYEKLMKAYAITS